MCSYHREQDPVTCTCNIICSCRTVTKIAVDFQVLMQLWVWHSISGWESITKSWIQMCCMGVADIIYVSFSLSSSFFQSSFFDRSVLILLLSFFFISFNLQKIYFRKLWWDSKWSLAPFVPQTHVWFLLSFLCTLLLNIHLIYFVQCLSSFVTVESNVLSPNPVLSQ